MTELQRAFAADFDLAHVAHVEQPGLAAHREVLLDHALVLHRHFPAGKFHHFRARAPMRGIKRSSFAPLHHRRRATQLLNAHAAENLSQLLRY